MIARVLVPMLAYISQSRGVMNREFGGCRARFSNKMARTKRCWSLCVCCYHLWKGRAKSCPSFLNAHAYG